MVSRNFETVGVRAVVEGVGQYSSGANTLATANERINTSSRAAASGSEQFGRSLQGLGSRMRESGTQATFLGASLAAPGVAAVKMALNFDTAITKISTLSGVAERDLDELREGITRISSESGRGPQELATGLLAITSTGLRGAQALDVLESSAKASALGLGETETVGRLLTGTLKAYERTGLTASRATDILFATVREGGAEATQVADSLGRVTGIAATFGVTMEEVGAFIATFTRLGIGADEAVTALRGTISSIFAPANETKEALEAAGLSAAELQSIVRERGLVAALEVLVTTFEGNSEALSAVIPNVRALAGVLGTAGSQAEGYAQVLDAVKNSQDDFNEAFAQLQETPGFQFQQALADLQSALINLGANGLPVLVQVIAVVSDVVAAFTSLPESVQTTILAISLVGGGLLALGGAATFIIGSITSLTGALALLTGGLGGLGAIAAANPLVLAVLGVAAVGAGVGYLFLKDKINEASDAAERNKEVAAVTALAQGAASDQLASQVVVLQSLIAAEESELASRKASSDASSENKVRIEELNDSLESNRAQVETLTEAQRVAAVVEGNTVEQIRAYISGTIDLIAATNHNIRVLEEENKSAATSLQRKKDNREEIARLRGQTTEYTTVLGRFNSALGIATAKEDQLGRQAVATGNNLNIAAGAADNASTAVFVLGENAVEAARKLAGLTAQTIANEALLKVVQKYEGTFGTSFLFGSGDPAAELAQMQPGLEVLLHQAEDFRALADKLAVDLTHSIGKMTAEEERAAKAASSAAETAANEAERAAEKAANEAERTAEEAVRALEELAERAARTAQEAAAAAQRIAEDAAAAAVRAAEEAASAFDRIIRDEIESLDQLGSLLVTALRRQAQQALNAQTAAIKAERDARTTASRSTIEALERQRDAAVKAAETTRDREIAAIEAARDARLAAIRAQTDARVAALERELGIIDQQRTAEQRAELQRELALAFEPEDRAAVLKKIVDFERGQREDAIRAQIKSIQDQAKVEEKVAEDTADNAIDRANDTAKARIEAAKRAADGKIEQERRELDAAIANFDAQEAAARAAYDAITDEWAIQSAARVLVMNGEIDQIGALLDAFVPEWRAAGLSFGEAIKGGLRASNVADFIRATLAGVPDSSGQTPAALDRAAQIAGLEAMGRRLVEGGAPQIAVDDVARQIIALGAVPQFNNSTVQAGRREDEIRQRQQQGRDLKAGGAPEIVLEDLRRSLIAMGAVPEFRRGLDMGMVRRPMLASLDPGEVVMNREQQMGMGGVNIEAGAFANMFNGATFGSDARQTGRAIRAEIEAMFQDLGRGAHRAGFR